MCTRISSIPLPEGLTDVQKAEYIAFQDAVTEIENEWYKLDEGTNPDQKNCIDLINDIKDKRYAQADERLRIRIEVIEEQVKKETERLEQEKKDYQRILYDKFMKAYNQSYKSIIDQLKSILDKDFNAFVLKHSIDFPQFSSEPVMKTRTQQIDEGKPRVAQGEIEKDLKLIREIVKGEGSTE